MHRVTSFTGSALGPEELTRVLADYLAVEHARIIRRLLMLRCGLLALVTAVIGLVFHWLPAFASWFSVGTFLALPACAWLVELAQRFRLGRRLEEMPGAVTQPCDAGRPARKVIKST